MWEQLIAWIKNTRVGGMGGPVGNFEILSREATAIYAGTIAVALVVIIALTFIGFIGAGIYSAGYVLYIGSYNLIALIGLTVKHTKKKGKHK